jgi:peptidoglycan L-alanyl-D-glutamate endopeptidase CwlK
MDPRSEACLAQVEPDLCTVIRGAAQTPQPFEVTYGIRTLAAEEQAVATGHSQTLDSRHLPDQAGYAAAVDVTPLIDGELSFAPGEEAAVYGQLALQIKASAAAHGVAIEWGGDWQSFKDWGHFQLPWATHP